MKKNHRQWKISPELTLDYDNLYEEVKTNLDDMAVS